MDYSIAQQSNQGGREYNEDRTAVYEHEGSILLVLADGLGGHAGGDLASQTFVDAMGDSFSKATSKQLEKGDSFLTLSINYAHHSIHRRAVSQGFSVESPKTTCVVCLIHNNVATWAHSGDSRLYHIHKRKICNITDDHVSKKGGREANNPINRCVGGVESPRPEVSEPYEMQSGDVLFLASDGAWHSFQSDDLGDYVDPQHPSLGLDSLLRTLENRNKAPSDNLSIVVLFWGVKQLDKPTLDEFKNTKSANNAATASNAKKTPTEKFDIKDLDSAIFEIENFISELDEKL